MKFLLFATMLLSVSAFADEKKESTFEEKKQHVLTHLDEKAAALQTHKSCVTAATTEEAFKACQKANREAMKKFRHGRKEMRKGKK